MELMSERIKRLRIARGIKLLDVAERLQITSAAAWSYENANVVPRLHRLQALARLFGVTIQYLINGRD
jgi:transcriptional regulator with XRE-family HTH domain